MARPDLENKARDYVIELIKTLGPGLQDGHPRVFNVMFEPGPADTLQFDGQRWTYQYLVAIRGMNTLFGLTFCSKAKTISLDVSPQGEDK
jgi:hypothetical protein